MLYEVPLEPDFSENMGTYLERFVYYDPLSDESIARYRRHSAFINASGLIEEPWRPSPRHKRILKKILSYKDHVSFYWLGGRHKIPFVLIEPYGREPFNFVGITHTILPPPISAYGGGPFSTEVGLAMPTRSILCGNEIHTRYLDEIAELLIKGAEKLPRWNFVSDKERREARSRHSWGRK